jgi:hypothetical protein
MKASGRVFPYDRSIVINALYDTIDELGLLLVESDGTYGSLIICGEGNIGRVRIELDAAEVGAQTRVTVIPDNGKGGDWDSFCSMIFDELSATIRRACNLRET